MPRLHSTLPSPLSSRHHCARPCLSSLPRPAHDCQPTLLRPDRRAVKSAEHIIAVSESTKSDLVTLAGAEAAKISVVYEAAGPHFQPASAEAIGIAKQHYAITGEYILFVSTIEPRKNIPFLLQAYAYLRENWSSDVVCPKLVLAGRRGWLCESIFAVLEELKLGDAVIVTGGVPVEDLPGLYSGACCFVLPSLYEGFGLPVLEAMSCGAPVIATHTSSLPEVTGDAAILVDPQDMVGLADAMRLVCTDADRRRSMREKGLRQAGRFSWERAARETLACYQTVSDAH